MRFLTVALCAVLVAGCSASLEDRLAWTDAGEHDVGKASFISHGWSLTPVDARIVQMYEDGAERDALAVTYAIKNVGVGQDRFFDGTSWSIPRVQFGAVSYGTARHGSWAHRWYCDYYSGEDHVYFHSGNRNPKIRPGESVRFTVCFGADRSRSGELEPPFVLSLADKDGRHVITFDLQRHMAAGGDSG